jgi:clan AA aspartic protease
MGEIRVKAKLENEVDRMLCKRGYIKDAEVRSFEIDALVDTGAVLVLLPQDLVEKLGLEMNEKVVVTLAKDQKVELPRARGGITLTIGDRSMTTDCLVGPPTCEPLIGQIVLESLDLIPDPIKKTLVPRPESPFLPSLKLK